jgi:hypothetical protein
LEEKILNGDEREGLIKMATRDSRALVLFGRGDCKCRGVCGSRTIWCREQVKRDMDKTGWTFQVLVSLGFYIT